jgi:two-component system, chemotaxis family, protein-glutamate methylesterase/glutaminase
MKTIVIGASAGGTLALKEIVRQLPAGFPASVLIVLHIAARFEDELPDILSDAGPLPAHHAVNGELALPGHIYLAPPDRHLCVEPGKVRLEDGPKESLARPSVDTLFRSAAKSYGPDVIGVLLTGRLYDGTAGLQAITHAGGVTIVQDPKDAQSPWMPQHALHHTPIDYCLPLAGIAPLLVSLAAVPG